VVPASGNPWIAGQRIGLGPALSGRAVVLSVGLDHVHVYLDGHWIKTLPSRLDRTDIARLLTAGARPARQPAQEPASNSVIDLERAVNASGNANLGGHVISAGIPLADQRVTLRLDGPVAHILSGGVLARTVTCPVPEQNRRRLRGARPGQVAPPQLPEAQIVKRRVSVRRAIMVGRQRIRFGPACRQDRRDHHRLGHRPHCRRRPVMAAIMPATHRPVIWIPLRRPATALRSLPTYWQPRVRRTSSGANPPHINWSYAHH
jgi:hypothetical protein